tara:strand:- start:3774 stop:5474 length:1701 start_codon:yes stop_codon:yes gene_type:complete
MAYSDPIEIKLKKNINSNSSFLSERSFEDLAKSKVPIDESVIKNFYSNVFQDIPSSGTNSHAEIVLASDDYINRNYYNKIKNRNKKQTERIAELENKLIILNNPSIKDHPVYADGSFLMIGDGNGRQHQDHNDIFLMQEGYIRRFDNWDLYVAVRSAWGLPPDSTGIYYASLDEINELRDIKGGVGIALHSDLLLFGDSLRTDLDDILGISAYLELELTCMGNEVNDYVNSLMGYENDSLPQSFNEEATSNFNNLQNVQYYLNNQACKVKYVKDDFYNDDVGPIIEEIIIPADTTQTIKILRESMGSNNNMPLNMNQYYDQYNITNFVYNGNTINNYIREWGPTGKYTSVVHATGRIKYKELYHPVVHGDIPTGLGLPYNETAYIFNGLPTGDTGNWETDSSITLIDYDGYTGQEKSIHGTKMLYDESGLFGSLGQNSTVQGFFDDNSHRYYWPQYKYDDVYYPIYGQPIIKMDGDYYVLLKVYRTGHGGNRCRLYDLKNGGTKRINKGTLEDETGLTADFHGGIVYWNNIKSSKLKFKGLQGWKPNAHSANDNPFNTIANGSNYG